MSDRVMVVNTYVGNQEGPRVRRWFRRLRVDVAIISELGNLDEHLDVGGKTFFSRGDTPHDSAIWVVGSRLDSILAIAGWQLTPFIPRPKSRAKRLWRDRWVVRVRVGRKVYWSIHANAAISDGKGGFNDSHGARAWKKALREVIEGVQRDIDKGLRVRLGGDFNMGEGTHQLSPNKIFEALGMDYMSDGRVMWLGWTDVAVRKQVLGTAPGADAHRVIVVDLKKPPNKRK